MPLKVTCGCMAQPSNVPNMAESTGTMPNTALLNPMPPDPDPDPNPEDSNASLTHNSPAPDADTLNQDPLVASGVSNASSSLSNSNMHSMNKCMTSVEQELRNFKASSMPNSTISSTK